MMLLEDRERWKAPERFASEISIYEEGRQAFLLGYSNPYAQQTLAHDEWQAGYDDVENGEKR